MDRDTHDTLESFDTIDLGQDSGDAPLVFERYDTEVVTERLSAVDVEDDPTLQTAIHGTLPVRASDPLIPPPGFIRPSAGRPRFR